ncbi:MAG: hypothetical protein WD228_11550 [Mycobacterium sp.]
MTTAVIVGGAVLVGMGLVASQLFRLKDWLARQPPPPPQGEDGGTVSPNEPEPS